MTQNSRDLRQRALGTSRPRGGRAWAPTALPHPRGQLPRGPGNTRCERPPRGPPVLQAPTQKAWVHLMEAAETVLALPLPSPANLVPHAFQVVYRRPSEGGTIIAPALQMGKLRQRGFAAAAEPQPLDCAAHHAEVSLSSGRGRGANTFPGGRRAVGCVGSHPSAPGVGRRHLPHR